MFARLQNCTRLVPIPSGLPAAVYSTSYYCCVSLEKSVFTDLNFANYEYQIMLFAGHNKTLFCPWGRVALSFGRVAQGDRTNASCGPFAQWSWWTERSQSCELRKQVFFQYRSRPSVGSSEVDGFKFMFTSASCSQKSGIGSGSAGRNCSAAAEEGVD